MQELQEFIETGMKFHGHKCPAMPLGVRAGLAAMKVLGVNRSQDKELFLRSETGKGHAAGCFLDGLMTATGCTYGKSNIEKLYYNKMAFTLVDTKTGHSVRVSLKPDFFQMSLNSPFVQQRKAGVAPQDISPAIADPLVKKVLSIPEDVFLSIEPIQTEKVTQKSGIFAVKPCEKCGELVFVNKLRMRVDGKLTCLPCSGYSD
ncbi:MAG: formylmethanofuran dehydrogenase [Proteobacteria bacterium]|nr:formylmethanofuran dehydrogenase [Pseudomonadota bacterium]MBU1060366.1 formylmethanofuran dehydrogenase [Pseudomonadota bacterium]